jgi:hypothetical protein
MVIMSPKKEQTTENLNVNSKRTNVKTNHLKVTKEKEPPKRTTVKQPLTDAQRAKLKEKITDWITTSNVAKKPMQYSQAWGKLYNDIDALGGAVNGITQIEQDEFPLCIEYINQKIAIIMSNKSVRNKYSGNRKKYISSIQARCKELGVSDETRKAYMLAKYGKDSLAESAANPFTNDELYDFYQYVMGNPKFSPPKIEMAGTHELREKALARFIDGYAADMAGRGIEIDRQALRYPGGKKAIFEALQQQEPTLFDADMTLSAFDKFWLKQRVCKAKR